MSRHRPCGANESRSTRLPLAPHGPGRFGDCPSLWPYKTQDNKTQDARLEKRAQRFCICSSLESCSLASEAKPRLSDHAHNAGLAKVPSQKDTALWQVPLHVRPCRMAGTFSPNGPARNGTCQSPVAKGHGTLASAAPAASLPQIVLRLARHPASQCQVKSQMWGWPAGFNQPIAHFQMALVLEVGCQPPPLQPNTKIMRLKQSFNCKAPKFLLDRGAELRDRVARGSHRP